MCCLHAPRFGSDVSGLCVASEAAAATATKAHINTLHGLWFSICWAGLGCHAHWHMCAWIVVDGFFVCTQYILNVCVLCVFVCECVTTSTVYGLVKWPYNIEEHHKPPKHNNSRQKKKRATAAANNDPSDLVLKALSWMYEFVGSTTNKRRLSGFQN